MEDKRRPRTGAPPACAQASNPQTPILVRSQSAIKMPAEVADFPLFTTTYAVRGSQQRDAGSAGCIGGSYLGQDTIFAFFHSVKTRYSIHESLFEES